MAFKSLTIVGGAMYGLGGERLDHVVGRVQVNKEVVARRATCSGATIPSSLPTFSGTS
jgi:hypothetical protein